MSKKDGTFSVLFQDNTHFQGNLLEGDWLRLDDIGIKEVLFTFGGKMVKMEYYREYSLTYEIHSMLGKSAINNITLAGRDENLSTVIIFDFKKQEVIKKVVEKYQELPWISKSWKKGVDYGKAQSYHG